MAVVERTSEVGEAVFDAVFPCGVVVGVEFFVDYAVGLLDFGVGGALEGEVECFKQIPAE